MCLRSRAFSPTPPDAVFCESSPPRSAQERQRRAKKTLEEMMRYIPGDFGCLFWCRNKCLMVVIHTPFTFRPSGEMHRGRGQARRSCSPLRRAAAAGSEQAGTRTPSALDLLPVCHRGVWGLQRSAPRSPPPRSLRFYICLSAVNVSSWIFTVCLCSDCLFAEIRHLQNKNPKNLHNPIPIPSSSCSVHPVSSKDHFMFSLS